jgi:hypothetical protein
LIISKEHEDPEVASDEVENHNEIIYPFAYSGKKTHIELEEKKLNSNYLIIANRP